MGKLASRAGHFALLCANCGHSSEFHNLPSENSDNKIQAGPEDYDCGGGAAAGCQCEGFIRIEDSRQ